MTSAEPDKTSPDTIANRIEIRHLRYFIAVAEEMHFGRAAQRLHIAQPALSRQIANLEATFGGLLFDRTRAQIKLTTAGTTLLPRARELLARLGELADATRRATAGGEGVLEIGFVGSATYSILPYVLKLYRARFPRVNLLLRHMHNIELIKALVDRRIQVAFTRPGTRDPEIANDLVVREALMVAMPQDDVLSGQSSVTLEDLADRPFILPNPHVEDHLRNVCKQVGFQPVVGQETMDLQTALNLVAGGLGVALVPESVGRAHRLNIAYRPLSEPRLSTDLILSYRRDNTDRLLLAFRSLVQEYKALHAATPLRVAG